MGETPNQPFSALLQCLSQDRFSRFPRHLRRRLGSGARTRRATQLRRTYRTTPEGPPPWQEYAVSLRRPAPAVGVQSLGRIRGCERCRASLAGFDVPVDRLRENLGSWCGADLSIADLRDRDAGRGGELCGTGTAQPGIDRQSGNDGFRLPDDPGHGFDGDSGVGGARAERLQRVLRVHLL